MKVETIHSSTDFSNSVVPANSLLLFIASDTNNNPVISYKDSSGQTGVFSITADPNFTANNIKYNVDIAGVTGTFTGDGDATSGDILSGKKAYVKGALVTGAITEAGAITSNNLTVTVPEGYIASARTVTLTDANLTAANIKDGVTIFGVTGTYTGGSTLYFYLPFSTNSTATVNGATVDQTGWKDYVDDPTSAPTVTTIDGKACMPFDGTVHLDTTLPASFWSSSCTITLFVYQTGSSRTGYIAASADGWFGIDSIADVYTIWAGNGDNGWPNVTGDNSQGRSDVSIITNAWTHIAYVRDITTHTFTLYINGTLAKTVTLPSESWGPVDYKYFRLGAWGNGDYVFEGAMRQIRIFTSALTAQEISAIYTADSV